MGEPAVRVLLFSDLFGSFVDESGSFEACLESYRALVEAGVEVVFITGAPLEVARETLKDLQPQATVIADGGRSVSAIPGSPLANLGEKLLPANDAEPDQREAARRVIAEYGKNGDIVLSIGVGDSADDTFLVAMDLAALIPGTGGAICPAIPRPAAVYKCQRAGQAGWNEWAEQMLKKMKIELVRDP
jgi:predicted mannosyl-3-phosphoglycerate phosphatase (HAD superfamily)